MLTATLDHKPLPKLQIRTYRVQVTQPVPQSELLDLEVFDLPVLAGPGEYARIERYVESQLPGWTLQGALDVALIGEEF